MSQVFIHDTGVVFIGHYFINDKNLKSNEKIHHVMIDEHRFAFKTDHGVFSKKGLDFGSRLLIDTVKNQAYQNVLDLGCGYGPLGIVLKSLGPKATVTMVDINQRAVELTKQNAGMNHVDVCAYVSDGLEGVTGQFDMIVTNPPIRAGKKTIYRFFKNSKAYLTKEGSLYIVIQKKQGASSTKAFCETIYNEVKVIQKKSGYQIIKCGL
ncbi:MAG TPA: methyltransferase [Candidatus Izemoplasmatales bacterium]|nr:methyltransferase [Candidatus Izemoplasmatales bacterium]